MPEESRLKKYARAVARGATARRFTWEEYDDAGLRRAHIAGVFFAASAMLGGGTYLFNKALSHDTPKIFNLDPATCGGTQVVRDSNGQVTQIVLPPGCGMHRAAKP